MELVGHSVLGFLQENGGSTSPMRQVYDRSSQHLHSREMGKAPNRGNINGLVQEIGGGSSLLSFRGKNEGASSFAWRDQEDGGCYERMEGGFGSLLRGDVNMSLVGESSYHGGWLFTEATAVEDSTQESDAARGRGMTMAQTQTQTQTQTQKRPYTGESSQATNKKQCMTGASKSSPSSSKPKPVLLSSKDPQSVAAKNRRERISERLKILQDLVPNGNKVDLVTMLEKAISYVKFLQLQVKVLATDEFWPAQGGKAPNIAQVKEAIDTILSSQRSETSSSSK